MQDQTINSKKPYLAPQFSIYGSVSILTLNTANMGTVSDAAQGNALKTA